MATTVSQIYFLFQFCNFAHLRTLKSIYTLNSGEIPQSVAEILLTLVSENKQYDRQSD